MRNIRKIAGVAAAFALCVSSAVCAFAAEKTEYRYVSGENVLVVGEDANKAVTAMGKANSEKTLSNCAAGSAYAKDKVYMYDDCDVHISTNEKGRQLVWEIDLTSASAATEEGLKLGDTPATVKKLYPTATENYGIYTATLGCTQVIVDCGIKNDKVVAISYQYCEAK